MTETSAATLTSQALNSARELHRSVLALPALRELHETTTKQLWIELFRATGCPVEDTLAAAIRALDNLQAALESRHAMHALPGILGLRAHLDTIETYLDQVPLAPASRAASPSAAHDLPTSGILLRLLQQRKAMPAVRAPVSTTAPRSPASRLKQSAPMPEKRSRARPSRGVRDAAGSRWVA